MNDTVKHSITAIATAIVTVSATYANDAMAKRKTQELAWNDRRDQSCYAEGITESLAKERGPKGVFSKTCPTGNTFILVTNEDGKQLVKWVLYESIVTQIAAIPRAFAGENTKPAQKVTVIDSVQNPDGTRSLTIEGIFHIESGILPRNPKLKCVRQIIDPGTGQIIRTEAVECLTEEQRRQSR
jgi:hypothetical protein